MLLAKHRIELPLVYEAGVVDKMSDVCDLKVVPLVILFAVGPGLRLHSLFMKFGLDTDVRMVSSALFLGRCPLLPYKRRFQKG